jgi:hypothetical protein
MSFFFLMHYGNIVEEVFSFIFCVIAVVVLSKLFLITTIINYARKGRKMMVFNLVLLILNILFWIPVVDFLPGIITLPLVFLLVLTLLNFKTMKEIEKRKTT